jgi:hypothetical protein
MSKKKSKIAKRFGYTFAGEAYALAVSLLEDGREAEAFMAVKASLMSKDAKELASEMNNRNESALVEANLINDPVADEDADDDDSVLETLEEIAAFAQENSSSDPDEYEDNDEEEYSEMEDEEDEDMEDDDETEEEEDEDDDDDLGDDEDDDDPLGLDDEEDEDDDENSEEDEAPEESSEFDEPVEDEEDLEVEDKLESFEQRANNFNQRQLSKRKKAVARAVNNKASLGKRR